MKASDIMTAQVITVNPNTAVRHIAALLFKHRISAVPVLENGKLVGIVSEADLLHRYEIGTEDARRPSSWWLRLLSGEPSAAQYVKSHARRARDIMTSDVVYVAPDTPIDEIATLLEKRGVKRVPVLRRRKVVGIVSRSNLVQALAARKTGVNAGETTDRAIRERLCAELERHSWWRSTISNVIVTDGVVHYFGGVDAEDQRRPARIAAENVAGVREVHDHRVPLAATVWAV